MDFLELSEKRFTAKKFDPSKSISAEDFDKLKKILQLAPSSVNSQPWIFLTGSSEETKKRIRPAVADFNWPRLDTCSHFVLIAVRNGLSDKYQHRLLEQETKDGRVANEEAAKEIYDGRQYFINLREQVGETLNWERNRHTSQ